MPMPASMLASDFRSAPAQCAPEGESLLHPAAFSPFLKLPTELRLIIWSFALHGPRAIPVSFDGDRVERTSVQKRYNLRARAPEQEYSRKGGFIPTGLRTPSLLHVNREARQQTLKQYQLFTFRSSSKCRSLNFYANLSIDLIYVASPVWDHPEFTWDYTGLDPRQSLAHKAIARFCMVLKQNPKRIAISSNLWGLLDLEAILPSMSGIELLLICDEDVEFSSVFTKEGLTLSTWCYNSWSYEDSDDEHEELIEEFCVEIKAIADKIGIKNFKMPYIHFKHLF